MRTMLKSKLLLSPNNVTISVHPATRPQSVLHVIRASNLVVASGRAMVRNLIANSGPALSSMAVGDDGTATTDTMLSLNNEVYRKVFDARTTSGSSVLFTVYFDATMANGSTLQEAGLFYGDLYELDALTTGGTLFARVVHTPIVKDASVLLTYTWEVPISSA